MVGPDTALIWDAIQIGALAIAAGAAGAWLLLRRKAARNSDVIEETSRTGSLEERVRVLERIATDRPSELAAEIEALREKSLEAK